MSLPRLSGWAAARRDVGVALVGDPDLVFLDEPTRGLDNPPDLLSH